MEFQLTATMAKFAKILGILALGIILFGCAAQPSKQASTPTVPTLTAAPATTLIITPVPAATPAQAPAPTPIPTPSMPSILQVKSAVETQINALFPNAAFSLLELSYPVGGSVVQERKYYEKEAGFTSTAPSGVSKPVRLTMRLSTIYPGETFDKGYSASATTTVDGRQMTYEEGGIDTKSSILCYNSSYGITFSIYNSAQVWDADANDWKKITAKDLFASLSKACPA